MLSIWLSGVLSLWIWVFRVLLTRLRSSSESPVLLVPRTTNLLRPSPSLALRFGRSTAFPAGAVLVWFRCRAGNPPRGICVGRGARPSRALVSASRRNKLEKPKRLPPRCPCSPEQTRLFPGRGGRRIAAGMRLKFLFQPLVQGREFLLSLAFEFLT
jgi:hypothetical protein